MPPVPLLEGSPPELPAMGTVPARRWGRVQLTMSPGGPCRPWGPMGPGSPWGRQRDEGGCGYHPAQGSCAHPPLRSPPLPAGPCSPGDRVCRSHPKRRKGHRGQRSTCRPWPRTEVPRAATTARPPLPPSLTFGPGRPGCPVFPLKPWREKKAGWGSWLPQEAGDPNPGTCRGPRPAAPGWEQWPPPTLPLTHPWAQ